MSWWHGNVSLLMEYVSHLCERYVMITMLSKNRDVYVHVRVSANLDDARLQHTEYATAGLKLDP